MEKKEQVKGTFNYPKHKHPHGVDDAKPNKNRIWVCTECPHFFTDNEIRQDSIWAHPCKQHPCRKRQRCESHLEPFIPELPLYSDPPSPEPPEKVREDIVKEIWKYTFSTESSQRLADSIILKLQQAGWGDLKEAQAEIAELLRTKAEMFAEYEDKIGHLQQKEVWLTEHCNKIDEQHKEINSNLTKRIGEMFTTIQTQAEQISCLISASSDHEIEVAEARQQALKELKDYVCNECSTPNFVNVVIPKRIWDDWQK